jgi:hypothetical protein
MVCSVIAGEAQQSPGNPERLISAAIEIASSLHPRNDQDQNRQNSGIGYGLLVMAVFRIDSGLDLLFH